MKNIAVMTPFLNRGGAERIAGLLSKYLSKYYNVYVFVDNIEDQVYEYGGKLVHIGADGDEFREYNMQYYKRLYNIDCAISFLEGMNFPNLRTCCGEKIIVSERRTQSVSNPPYYQDFADEIQLYNRADKIIAVAEGVKYDLVHNYGIEASKIDTIYNFIDQDIIINKSKEKLPDEIEGFVGNSKLIINVGRLEEQKNQKKLLVQFFSLLKDGIDAKLIIIGSGPLKKQLTDMVDERKMQDRVRILEYSQNPFPYYRRADVFALSSSFEGLPNVVLEAMTLGVPVVATDCFSGPRELLDDSVDYSKNISEYKVCKRGILVTPVQTENDGSTVYYKEALKAILTDSKLCETIRDNQRIYMSCYTNQNIIQKWITAIEEPSDRGSSFELKKRGSFSKQVILYGAGWCGRRILPRFLERKDEMELLCFAVSSEAGNKKEIAGIPVFSIDKLTEYKETADVVISAGIQYVDEIMNTLKSKGFKNLYVPFMSKPEYKDYLDYKHLEASEYRKELSMRYLITYGEKLRWNNPEKYSEKMQILKNNFQDKTYFLLDKYEARNYVEKKIGEQYLSELLGVWQSFDEISFSELPDGFTLVCTHGKGWETDIYTKEEADLPKLKEQINRWMSLNYAYTKGLDQRYRNITHRIMAEKRLYDKATAMSYSFLVFHGKVKMIEMSDGQLMEWEQNLQGTSEPLLCKMIALAERIGEGMQHIVVRFQIANGNIFFESIDLEYGDEENPIDEKNDIILGSFIDC